MKRHLLFFVDDDKAIRNLIEYTICLKNDCDIRTFATGEECIASLELSPSLIVLDHMLIHSNSKYNGLQILKEIRNRKINVPVFVLSSETNEKIINEYYENGVTQFVKKDGFFVDKIIEFLEQHLPES